PFFFERPFNIGKIHMPRQRRSAVWSKIFLCLIARTCFSIKRLVRGRGRLIGKISGSLAEQNSFSGHIPHFGLRGRQITAPRSSSAELYTPDELFGTRPVA